MGGGDDTKNETVKKKFVVLSFVTLVAFHLLWRIFWQLEKLLKKGTYFVHWFMIKIQKNRVCQKAINAETIFMP